MVAAVIRQYKSIVWRKGEKALTGRQGGRRVGPVSLQGLTC